MDIFRQSERLMSMDDVAWARHANPMSVYSRFTCLPLLCLAIWSRAWIGFWSLIPIALAMAWTWYNPRAFGRPPHASASRWPSQAVFGERVFLNRREIPIPKHHEVMALRLTIASTIGALPLLYGLGALHLWATLLGLFATALPKVWFCDRMAWLYQDMKSAHPEYGAWESSGRDGLAP